MGHGLPGHHHAPAHSQVADHGEHLEAIHVDGGEDDTDDRSTPDHAEQRPTHLRIDAAQSAERQGSVAAGNEQVDGAVIQHAQHLLAQHHGTQAMVDTGDRVEQDHGCAKDRTSDHAHRVMPPCRSDHAEHRSHDAQRHTGCMGSHIKNFFPSCIVR